MSAVRSIIREVQSHGVTLSIDGGDLKLSGPHPLPADTMQRLRASKQVVIFELRAVLPWWRDPLELRARFDEIAGYLEFDNNCNRDEAERLAMEALARELRDEHGLSDAAAIRTLKPVKETER